MYRFVVCFEWSGRWGSVWKWLSCTWIVRVWCCGFALAVFILSVFPRSLFSLHVIVFCINPLPYLRASRRLVCSFFSFVTPLFQKDSLIETERNNEENTRTNSGLDLKSNGSKMKTVEMYNKVVCLRSRLHWLHCEALCAEPLVLPSLPDQCFLHGMILLSWRPRNWKIKKRRCLHGRSERERKRKEHRLHDVCLVTDTKAWHTVCLLRCAHCDIIELAVVSCLATVFIFVPFCVTTWDVMPQLPCQCVAFSVALVEWKISLSMLVHVLKWYVLHRLVGEASLIWADSWHIHNAASLYWDLYQQ